MSKPKKITTRVELTAEAARELFETAAEELYENCDTFEVHDLATWIKQLKRTVIRQSEHQYGSDDVPVWRGDPADLASGGAE